MFQEFPCARDENTPNTLIIFHAQNDFIQSDDLSDSIMKSAEFDDPSILRKRYLNNVCEIIHNGYYPFSNIVVMCDQSPVEDLNDDYNVCARGSEGEAIYGPLHDSLDKWAREHCTARVQFIQSRCYSRNGPGNEAFNEVALGEWEEKILGHLADIKADMHHIFVAGLFEHQCSKLSIGYVLKALIDETSIWQQKSQFEVNVVHMIHIIKPNNHSDWSDVASAQVDMFGSVYRDTVESTNDVIQADGKQAPCNLVGFDFVGLSEKKDEPDTTLQRMMVYQRAVNQLSHTFLGDPSYISHLTDAISNVYSNCERGRSLFTEGDRTNCVTNYEFPLTAGKEIIEKYLYLAPNSTWVDKFYLPYALLDESMEARVCNTGDYYRMPIPVMYDGDKWDVLNPVVFEREEAADGSVLFSGESLFVRGLGKLGKWGPNQAADMLRYSLDVDGLSVLIIKRPSGMWAVPGGFLEDDENAADAALREYHEEVLGRRQDGSDVSKMDRRKYWGLAADKVDEVMTGALPLNLYGLGVEKQDSMTNTPLSLKSHVVYRGYSPDARNTRNAWMETTCFASRATSKQELLAEAGSGNAYWNSLKAGTFREIVDIQVFRLADLNLGVGSVSDGNQPTMFAGHALFLSRLQSQVSDLQIEFPKPGMSNVTTIRKQYEGPRSAWGSRKY